MGFFYFISKTRHSWELKHGIRSPISRGLWNSGVQCKFHLYESV